MASRSLHVGRPGRDADPPLVGVGTALQVIEREREAIDEVFLSLDPELAAEELVLGLRMLDPPPRVIGVGDWDDLVPRIATWRLDAIAIGENRAPAFLDAPPAAKVRADRLAGLSLLGRGGAKAVVNGLAHAFGASGVTLWIASEDRLVESGDAPDAIRARRAAAVAMTLIVEGERAYLGAELHDEAGVVGAVCLVFDGAPPAGHDLLAAIAARLGLEVGAASRQRRFARAVSELGDERLRDDLGIYSRAFVREIVAIELARAVRQARPLAVAIVDVVGMHRINSEHGHAIGDDVLRELETVLRGELRAGDIVGRYRDGAFAIVMPETPLDLAIRALARPCDVAQAPLRVGKREIRLRLQVGVAAADAGDGPASLLARAAAAATVPGERRAASAQVAARESDRLPSGTVIGAYRVLHLIGEGGVGLVYRAEDVTLQRPVALKVLRPELAADPEFLTRFRSEATLLASIQHANLVHVFSLGEAPEGVFFAMELVEGETLSDAVQRNQKTGVYLPLDRLLACLGQIAAALDCLHQHGVLHRDVKPDNIALDPFRERAVLLDVGVAQRVGRGDLAAGTPGFVAPEVLAAGEVGPASDVFSLAVTAYQALAYRPPWASFESNPGQILATPDEAPRAISTFRAELAAADDLFARALSFDPKARPASAGALCAELGEVLMPLAATLDDPQAEARPSGRMPAIASPVSTVVDFREHPPSTQPPAQTRGVVFKALSRVIGNDLDGWRAAFPAELAEVLDPAHPGLAWCDARLFLDLLDRAHELAEAPEELARRYGRAVIRATFQRFFPASTSTLSPERVLAQLPAVWAKYQSWGKLTTMIADASANVRLEGVPRTCTLLPGWVEGVVAQTVVLCGGGEVAAAVTETGEGFVVVGLGWSQ